MGPPGRVWAHQRAGAPVCRLAARLQHAHTGSARTLGEVPWAGSRIAVKRAIPAGGERCRLPRVAPVCALLTCRPCFPTAPPAGWQYRTLARSCLLRHA